MKTHTPAVLAALSLLVAPAFAATLARDAEAKTSPARKTRNPIRALRPADTTGKETVVPEAADGKAAPVPWREWLPDAPLGKITLGVMASEDGVGAYLDSITGLWAPQKRDAFLFLDSRLHWEDNDQFISSTGLGFRKLLPAQEVIIGGNVFWDSIHSQEGNDLDQLGLGVEVLTHWVDFRLNYYLPEDDRFEVSRATSRRTRTNASAGGFTRTATRNEFTRFESGLEGFNTEIGFLIPGLEKYAEVRVYAGYYHYENPFGSDFDGFKGRLEARVLQGVTANLEYWNDEQLMGGHWTAEVAVSVPFSLHNLFTGRNPFAGAGDTFKPLPRPFSDRMSDMVERSHRIQTVTSDEVRTGRSRSSRFAPSAVEAPSPAGGGNVGGGFPIE
jgi:hypothetical protein